MKIKTSELKGLALDWAVAACLGLKPRMRHRYMREKAAANNYQGDLKWHLAQQANDPITVLDGVTSPLEGYSTDWAQGGPITDSEGISVFRLEHTYGVDAKGYTTRERIPVFGAVIGEYFETGRDRNGYGEDYGEIYYIGTDLVMYGPTPLIAAMRCYVASKLGDEVDVPEELL